jgi:hypothetical protein
MNVPLDGNALGGPLGEIFAVDVTAGLAQCAGCGSTGAVAAVRVYVTEMGSVARCPSCDDVLFRLVRRADRAWLDIRGVSLLQLQLPEP